MRFHASCGSGAAALALLVAVVGCSRELKDLRLSSRKVLLVGVDGLDLGLLKPLLDSTPTPMPRIVQLRAHAACAALEGEPFGMDPIGMGLDPARSWTTVATGAPAMKVEESSGPSHGVKQLLVRVKGSYDAVPATSLHSRLPPLWQILSSVGVRCAVSGWWTTWPAEAIDGWLVSDRFFLDRFDLGPFGPYGRIDLPKVPEKYRRGARYLTFPDELASELETALKPVVDHPGSPLVDHLTALFHQCGDTGVRADLEMLIGAVRSDLAVQRSMLHLLQKDPAIRFAACFFDELDVAIHLFLAPKEVAGISRQALSEVIPRVAGNVDRMVGELQDRMGAEAVVALVCDHALLLDQEGSRDYELSRLLERVGLLVRDEKGGVDWSRTRCFDRPLAPSYFVRTLSLNFVGDWPQGFVPAGAGTERGPAWEDVKRKLLGLQVDKEWTGENRQRMNTLFWGAAAIPKEWDMQFAVYQHLPADTKVLLPSGPVPLNELFPLRRASARHAAPTVNSARGELEHTGTFLLAFPGAEGERAAQRRVPMGKDHTSSAMVAPTLLALFGIPRSAREEEAMAEPVWWMLDRDEAHAVAVERVDSYADSLAREDPSSLLGARRALLQKHLAELGYLVGAPPE